MRHPFIEDEEENIRGRRIYLIIMEDESSLASFRTVSSIERPYSLSFYFFFSFFSLCKFIKRDEIFISFSVSSSFLFFFLFFLLQTIVNVRFFLSRYTSKKTTIFPDPPSKIIFPLRGNNYRHHNQHFDFDFRFLIQVLRRNQVVPKSDDLMFSIRSKKIED